MGPTLITLGFFGICFLIAIIISLIDGDTSLRRTKKIAEFCTGEWRPFLRPEETGAALLTRGQKRVECSGSEVHITRIPTP